MTNLEYAESYVSRGWRVLPLYWWNAEAGRCGCGRTNCESPGKHPIPQLAPNGSKSATSNIQTVRDWWGMMPKANIGIATGEESGLVVLDIDPRHGGDESVKWLIEDQGDFTKTLWAATGSGGHHYYFKHPGYPVKNSAGAVAEGVDVRGENGYVVAPPSNHASGGMYRWAFGESDTPPAPMPGWVAARDNATMPQVATKIEGMIPHGTQHHALVSLAGTMRRRGMGAEEIFAALQVTNRTRCERPGPEKNIRRIAESVCQYAPEEIIGAVDEAARASDPDAGPAMTRLAEVIEEAIERAEANRAAGGKMPGIPYGFSLLDKMTGGAIPSDLIIIAARPSMGKTALAVQVSKTFAAKAPGAIFSVEMAKLAVGQRYLSGESEIDSTELRSGMYDEASFKRLSAAAARLKELPIWINDESGITPVRMQALLEEMEDKPRWVIVDYLQLMQSAGKGDNREQEVASISRDLKGIAKRLDVPVIALAQLSRKNENRSDKRPMLSDLRDSGQIEQDADVVMFIHRPEKYGETHVEVKGSTVPSAGLAELIIAKQRNGPVGDVVLGFDEPFARFSDYDYVIGVVKQHAHLRRVEQYSYAKTDEVPF